MPELPEITARAGEMKEALAGRTITGIQVLQPIEVRVGLDVRKLKSEFGKDLTFMGNISVEMMNASPGVLEEEVRSKLEIAMKDGGYIYQRFAAWD